MRFLKAKLRVLQEELDRVCQEVAEKDKAMATSAARLKQLTDENAKLQRSYQTLQVGGLLECNLELSPHPPSILHPCRLRCQSIARVQARSSTSVKALRHSCWP